MGTHGQKRRSGRLRHNVRRETHTRAAELDSGDESDRAALLGIIMIILRPRLDLDTVIHYGVYGPRWTRPGGSPSSASLRASGPITLSSTTTTTAPVNRQPARCNNIIPLPYQWRPTIAIAVGVHCVWPVLRNIHSPSKRPRPSDKIDCTTKGIDFRLPARRLHRSSPTAGTYRFLLFVAIDRDQSTHTHTEATVRLE